MTAVLKQEAPAALSDAVLKAYTRWPRCRCGYPCEVSDVSEFARPRPGMVVMRATLGCVAGECACDLQVLYSRE